MCIYGEQKMKINEISRTDYDIGEDFYNAEYNEQQLVFIRKKSDFDFRGRKINVGAIGGASCLYIEKMGYMILYLEIEHFAKGVQVKIAWRDSKNKFDGADETRGLIGPLYTELVRRYGVVYSDDIQTQDGERLWRKLVVDASDKGYTVGQMRNGDHIPLDDPHNIDFIWKNEATVLYITA